MNGRTDDERTERGGWMKELLRKRELVEAIGVPKSTVADWIIEFHMFIPTTKVRSVTYYRPEAIPVLQEIRRLRDERYSKPEIMQELAKRFPMTVEGETAKELTQRIFDPEVYENMIKGMGRTVKRLEQHAQLLQQHHVKLKDQYEQIQVHERKIQEIEAKMSEVVQELAAAKAQLQKKKSWWRRLFDQ